MKKTLLILVILLIAFFGLLTNLNAANKNKTEEGTWISISGTVVNPRADELTLDYGKGTINVKMHDWKWYDKNYVKMNGDRITVYGKKTDEFFQKSTMDATSVYDEHMQRYFYGRAHGAKGDDWISGSPPPDYWITGTPIEVGDVKVRGIITNVDGRVFTIDTGSGKLIFDTLDMSSDPLYKPPYAKEGSYVAVTGNVRREFSKKHEITAAYIVTFSKDEE